MDQEENNGLDFEIDSGDASQLQTDHSSFNKHPSLKNISRQSFRIPLHEKNGIQVQIDKRHYDMINIVAFERVGIGIGVRVNQKEDFSVGDDLASIRFAILEKHFDVKGKVIHVSPDRDADYICGIELVDLTEKEKLIFRNFIRKFHTDMFSEK